MNAHTFQKVTCASLVEFGRVPILNAASKEDPAHLGTAFNAINFDLLDYDPHTKKNLREIKNFIRGDLLKASTFFKEEEFGAIILGEFIEHCVFDAVKKVLIELRIILQDEGLLVITFPLDARPPERQHGKALLVVHIAGDTGQDITSWHQTVWTDTMLEKLFAETGWKEVTRTPLDYGFVPDRCGWGLTLEKTL